MPNTKAQEMLTDAQRAFKDAQQDLIRRAKGLIRDLTQAVERLEQFDICNPTHINTGIDRDGVCQRESQRVDMLCAVLHERRRTVEALRELL